MQTITSGAEYRWKEMLEDIEREKNAWRVQLFRISNLGGQVHIKDVSKVAFNIIHPRLKDEEGGMFFLEDGDIVILCTAVPKKTLEEIAYQLEYLFSENLTEDEASDFHMLYDLGISWAEIHSLCQKKLKATLTKKKKEVAAKSTKVMPEATLEDIEHDVARQALMKRFTREKTCVLLVEDDPLSLRMAKNTLKDEFTVVTSETGKDAYNAYLLNAPDVVFLDIGLPDCEGHQVLEKILTLDPGAYIIMLSGNTLKEEIMKAMHLGAKGFVGKPFTKEKLLQYIHKSPTFKESAVA